MKKDTITRTSMLEAIAESTYESRPLSDDEMFEIFDIDPKVWFVEKKIVNTWAKNFQTKLWLKRIEGAFESTVAHDLLKAWERKKAPKLPKACKQPARAERLLEIFPTDCHFDKLAWEQESGDNFDIKIARSIYLDAIRTLLKRAEPLGFDKVLFVVGSDMFNSEGRRATTTKGTPQTVDVRWQKSFDFVTTTVREAIDMCAEHVPVDVVVIPGNHDYERTYYLGSVLSAWFETDPIINVDNSPMSRKYYQFGKNLFMLEHGELKPADYGIIMATEEPKKWANTDKRFVHAGHTHGREKLVRMVDEQYGVIFERFPSFTGTDEWHFNNGYIGNQKSALAKIFDASMGPIYDISYYIPRSMYTKR